MNVVNGEMPEVGLWQYLCRNTAAVLLSLGQSPRHLEVPQGHTHEDRERCHFAALGSDAGVPLPQQKGALWEAPFQTCCHTVCGGL